MSIREAILRFQELHEDFKAGAFKSPDALKFYESERDDFLAALLQGQQLAIRPGQTARQALRVAAAFSLTFAFGPRKEVTTTIDIASTGFAANVSSPLALRIAGDFELGLQPKPALGRARVVACTRDAAGAYRTSFSIDTMPPEDRTRLEVAVIDIALEMQRKR
ncbi:MAG: hypothetical protein ACLQVI_13910 [Polyangiaceae bacterium]